MKGIQDSAKDNLALLLVFENKYSYMEFIVRIEVPNKSIYFDITI